MLDEVREKIHRLIGLYEEARSDKERLIAENKRLKIQIEHYRKQITELEKKVDSLTLKKAIEESSVSNAEAKRKVAGMIRILDKCISLME